jgi:ligand-binding sensor domain-containing protein
MQVYKNFRSSTIIIFAILTMAACTENKKVIKIDSPTTKQSIQSVAFDFSIFKNQRSTDILENVRRIFEDSRGNFWFGTDGSGIYAYDGDVLIKLTKDDGLPDNQIQSIQEDNLGNLWLGTGSFGITKFDGKKLEQKPSFHQIQASSLGGTWSKDPNDLWFFGTAGPVRYDGNTLTYCPFPKSIADFRPSTQSDKDLSSSAIYYSIKDRKGNMWFGTQARGVCRYDGKSFDWFTDMGLAGPAVRAIFEDRNGHMWFGNNGKGLIKYDGKTMRNITDELGLDNKEFLASEIQPKSEYPGTMARVWAINEDHQGHLWVATIDAGLWQFDGKNWKNYTTKDGLSSNTILTIHNDKKGRLWIGTTKELCMFNGKNFDKIHLLPK